MSSVKDILRMDIADISKLSRSELAHTVSILGSAANKRVKRASQTGAESPALRGLERSGGNISVKGKTTNELRHEFVRAKLFLESKTSTARGRKAVQKEFEERIGGHLTPAQTKDFWRVYNKMNEAQPAKIKGYGSDQLQQMLRQEMVQHPGNEDDDYLMWADDLLTAAYETMEDEYNEQEKAFESVSDFFELDEF